MKKIYKVFIAFVLIVFLSVSVYFVFFNKPNVKVVYTDVYSIQYEQMDNNSNKVKVVNDSILSINSFVNNNSNLNYKEGLKSQLQLFLNTQDFYQIIIDEILINGMNFTYDKSVSKYLKSMNKDYKILIKSYSNLYENLKNGYLNVKDSANLGTLVDHINNFYNDFEGFYLIFNNFYYNAGCVYAKTLNSTMNKNNLYKLKIEYYSTIVNLANTQDLTVRDSYLSLLPSAKNQVIDEDLVDVYFKNKSTIDNIFINAKNYDLKSVIDATINNTTQTLIDQQKSQEEKSLLTNYIKFVAQEV